ncbi:MAG: FHA domain-containing protein [Armatimonadia bacterium]|nr:FHA domain-containing protein [Armatimonadia bacterium]
MLRIALVTVGGTTGMALGLVVAGRGGPGWASTGLVLLGLAPGITLGLLVGEAVCGGRGRGWSGWLASLGYSMAGGLAASIAAGALLAVAGTRDEAALVTEPPRNPAIIAVACDMAATILAGSLTAAIAAAASLGVPRLRGRRGTLLWGGALGGGFGALLYELLLFFLPRWQRGVGGLTPPADPALLAGSWLCLMVGVGVILADRLGMVATFRRGGRLAAVHAGESFIGASPLCDTVLSGPGVRPVHLRATCAGKALTVTALEGAAMEVNGDPTSECELADGDELRLGASTFYVAYNYLRVRGDDVQRRARSADDHLPPAREGVQLVAVEGPMLGEILEIPEGLSVLGSGDDADLRLPGEGIAGRHATIVRSGARVRITDEEDTTGIQVNGERVETAALEAGAKVAVGEHLLLAVFGGERPETDEE